MGRGAGKYFRENPHDLPLGVIGLDVAAADGKAQPLTPGDIQGVTQRLDLWTGVITSEYTLDGKPVKVTTVCDPKSDIIGVRIESALVAEGKLGVRLAFPRGDDLKSKNTPAYDWSQPESHTTTLRLDGDRRALLDRTVGETRYGVEIEWNGPAKLTEEARHVFRLADTDQAATKLEFTVRFSPEALAGSWPDFPAVRAASEGKWPAFWRQGGAVDFSACTDPRAKELERRVVLSQWLTAIQFGGDVPPQETGLTCSSWYGKHNTEMSWWHVAHFALWGREAYTAKALDWYLKVLPAMRDVAKERGLKGARWSKMVGPDGRESPGVNAFIVWNQPHPIYLAELIYRNQPTRETLDKYREMIQESAECMASMLHWDGTRYVLGPPLLIAQEAYKPATSLNPTYELSYWAYGLDTANRWRERRGLKRVEEWDRMIANLSKLPEKNGKYVAIESTPDTWDNAERRLSHPSMLMALGMCRGDGVDRATMKRTLDAVLEKWNWKVGLWGWDYPMVAMTAARLGEPETAVDILLKADGVGNFYTPNGHCPHGKNLAVYLPANSSLLAAIALMAGGWDGAPEKEAPGFPKNGKWNVKVEGIHSLP
jgi:hypothetical protein